MTKNQTKSDLRANIHTCFTATDIDGRKTITHTKPVLLSCGLLEFLLATKNSDHVAEEREERDFDKELMVRTMDHVMDDEEFERNLAVLRAVALVGAEGQTVDFPLSG